MTSKYMQAVLVVMLSVAYSVALFMLADTCMTEYLRLEREQQLTRENFEAAVIGLGHNGWT